MHLKKNNKNLNYEKYTLKTIARDIFLKANQCEKNGCILEATDLYEEGIVELQKLIDQETRPSKLDVFNKELYEHMAHVQELRAQFDYHNRHGKLIEHIPIGEGATGHGYENVFGKYLTADVKEILIYEPWFNKRNQIKNVVGFLELLVKKCTNLRYVRFITRPASRPANHQINILKRIRYNLATKNIGFNYRFHDRLVEHMLVLSNGHIIKSSHGLNYFRTNGSVFDLGVCDYDFRRCIRSSLDIWLTCPFIQKIE